MIGMFQWSSLNLEADYKEVAQTQDKCWEKQVT